MATTRSDPTPQPALLWKRAGSALLVLFVGIQTAYGAADINDSTVIPHINDKARESYLSFAFAPEHRAFVIAPGGAWAWKSGMDSPEEATREAIRSCETYTQQHCIPYAINEEVVFDVERWVQLWGPYKHGIEARNAKDGKRVGERFPDLSFRDPNRDKLRLSDLRGKVVLLHFWGSWCSICCRELPGLDQLHKKLTSEDEIIIVTLQVREDYRDSLLFVQEKGLSLPLYDSGAFDEDDHYLKDGMGREIPDRKIARVFPASYILDKNGLVVFSQLGPVSHWPQFLPLLRDAAERSGN